MNTKVIRTIMVSSAVVIVIFLTVWTVWGNTAIELNSYTVKSAKLPASFDGLRIAQVSDLHNAEIGENNEKLLSMLREAKPDIIAVTGDMVDSRRTDIDIALKFAEEAAAIAPCYYVTGNHEARITDYQTLRDGLAEVGVTLLENKRTTVERNGEYIDLIGLDDPDFVTDYLFDEDAVVAGVNLERLADDEDEYVVLLSHRPELFDVYAENGIDLVLSGHAHGGQFRLPFIGGIFAPHQGFFPEYDSDLYTQGNTNMIVSRGIGNSVFPLRFNNRPEVVLIELHRDK